MFGTLKNNKTCGILLPSIRLLRKWGNELVAIFFLTILFLISNGISNSTKPGRPTTEVVLELLQNSKPIKVHHVFI
jgi:hypothetical protein